MMNCCSAQDKFDIKVEETSNGIQVNIDPKDKEKVESFKKMISACKDFTDGECC